MTVSTNERDLSKYAIAIQQLEQGRMNAAGNFTITPSATTTVVEAQNCGEASEVQITAKTANAAAALSTTFVSVVANGSFTVTHASNSQTDRIFGFVCLG